MEATTLLKKRKLDEVFENFFASTSEEERPMKDETLDRYMQIYMPRTESSYAMYIYFLIRAWNPLGHPPFLPYHPKYNPNGVDWEKKTISGKFDCMQGLPFHIVIRMILQCEIQTYKVNMTMRKVDIYNYLPSCYHGLSQNRYKREPPVGVVNNMMDLSWGRPTMMRWSKFHNMMVLNMDTEDRKKNKKLSERVDTYIRICPPWRKDGLFPTDWRTFKKWKRDRKKGICQHMSKGREVDVCNTCKDAKPVP